MLIKCVKCGKTYDEEKYFGICPKCGRYNREENASEKEHQELHNMYDDGYSHTEEDDHHRFHKAYDNHYQHESAQRDASAAAHPADASSASVREAAVRTNPAQPAAREPVTPQRPPQTSGQGTVSKVLKVVLFIILFQFVVRIIFALIGIFLVF